MFKIGNKSIVKIEVENAAGEVVSHIELDTMDTSTVERFRKLITNVEKISDSFTKDAKKVIDKYKDTVEIKDDGEITLEQIDAAVDISRVRIKYITQVVTEIDGVFGSGTMRAFFSDNYRIHEDFVPDEYALIEFIEQMIPVMSELYGQRFEMQRKKYNPSKRGATKPKRRYK